MTQISGQNWKCWHSTDWKETNNKTWMCSDWREVNCVRTGSLDEDVSSSQFLSERMSLTTRTRTCGRGVVCCPLVRSSATFCPAALGLGGVEWAWPPWCRHPVGKRMWWKFILRFEIMKFSDWSCHWVFIIVSSAEFTQQARVLRMEQLAASVKKPGLIQRGVSQDNMKNRRHARTNTKRCFIKRNKKKDMKSSSVSICCVRPL